MALAGRQGVQSFPDLIPFDQGTEASKYVKRLCRILTSPVEMALLLYGAGHNPRRHPFHRFHSSNFQLNLAKNGFIMDLIWIYPEDKVNVSESFHQECSGRCR